MPNKKQDSTATLLSNLIYTENKYYIDKTSIDKIGKIQAKQEDFSLLNKTIISSRASSENGTSAIYKYFDELGVKYMIHEVTDSNGFILHRDFDAVRIESGQIINKHH